MKPHFSVTEKTLNTSYAPLCVLGQAFWEGKTLDPLREFDLISLKSHVHTPGEKLMDAFLLILAGYPSLYLLNNTLVPYQPVQKPKIAPKAMWVKKSKGSPTGAGDDLPLSRIIIIAGVSRQST